MPDPILVDVDIVNRALGRIGERPLQSLDEETELAGQVASVYNDVVDTAHAVYQWKWARRTSRLDAMAPAMAVVNGVAMAESFNGWPFAFNFPTDALSSPLALYRSWPDETLREFTVEGKVIYTRQGVVFGSFIRRLSPDQWPAPFRIAVTSWLAAQLAIPCTHDKDLAAQLEEAAIGAPSEQMRGGLMGRAIAFDVSTGGGSAVSSMQSDVLTTARYAGEWWG